MNRGNCNVAYGYKNVWNNCNISVPDEKHQILEWLSPLTSRERHGAIRDARADGVGDWLLREGKFSTWHTLEDVKPVLLFYGDPGVGKTYISSLVIDTLCKETYPEAVTITYVYCDFTAREVQSVSNLLGSVLRQVIAAMTETPSEVLGAFEHARKHADGRRLQLSEILTLLVCCLSNLKRSFICIDALDEFPQKERPELWKSLRSLTQKCPGTRLFLTGRPHIGEEVRKHFPETAEMLQIDTQVGDIGLYLTARLDGDPEPDAMDEELQADILKVIPEKISGIFLLVRINMDAILAEPTIHGRRQVLDGMTNGRGLEDAYNATMERIRQQGGSKARLGMEALMWICHCERPLSPDELCHALGVDLRTEDFNMNNVPSLRAVLGCTLGLVTAGEKDSTVRLLHFTLQEYLGEHPTLPTAHSMMAEVCLTYLNSRFIRTLDVRPDTAMIRAPFLKYATCSWGTHTSVEVTEPLKLLALRLLYGYENHLSAAILWREKIMPKWHFPREVDGISGLHCIAFWGIAEIAIIMLEMKRWDVDARDSRGDTALMWAVRYGNDKVAELLLAQPEIGSDVVVAGSHAVHSFTPQWGNEGVVKLLLEHTDINPNLPDNCGRTPLSFAAKSGREGVVKLLLEGRDVNPNTPDSRGLTPLSYATIGGREDIVRLFRERGDANPDPSDGNDRSPISPDTEHRHQCALELLSKYGNPGSEAPETRDRTPVSIPDEDIPVQVAVPLPTPGGATPYSTDDLLEYSTLPTRPTIPRPPQEQSLSRKQSLLNQPDSGPAPPTPYSILRSSLALFFFLIPLLLLLVFHGYGDSHRLSHLISRTWQWLIQYFNFR